MIDTAYPPVERRSYSDLQTLHEISEMILESLDLGTLMDRILEKTLERGNFDIGMIRLLDPRENRLEPVSSRGYRDPSNIERQRKSTADPSSLRLLDRVISRKETRIDDLASVKGMRAFKREGVSTMVTVPLRTRTDVLGVIHLGNRAPRRLEAREIRLLEAIGAQAGIAVQKIRLLHAAERRAKEQEILNEIAAATNQSLELGELFEIAATKIVEATGRRRINLRLKDSATGLVTVVTSRGFSDEEMESLRRVAPHPMTERVFATGEPLVMNRNARTAAALLPRTQSVAWIPIKASSRVVGVIGISDDQSRPFGCTEVDLLQAIGHVIGVAIENARLFGETRRNLEKMRVLHKVASATVSTLDLGEMLDIFLRTVHEAYPYVAASTVSLFDRATGMLEPTAWYGIDPDEWREPRDCREGLTQVVCSAKGPVTVRNLKNELSASEAAKLSGRGLVSYIGVPLLLRERLLGVLSFFTKEERDFTREEIDFVATLASQAAIAIQNATLYEQTRTQARELEKANRMQADFVAMIAHDLRSPLMNISGAAEVMLKGIFGPLSSEQTRWLGKIVANGHNLISLVSDFLELSKLEAGYVMLAREMLDIDPVINKCLESFAIAAREKDITVTTAISAAVPPVYVDRRRIEQVLSNLLNNAFKFTGRGGHVEVGAASENESFVRVWVKDDGIGIPALELADIFEKYRQASNAETCGHKGTGLGLVICKMIVQGHGGRIWVESEEGRGATFSVSLSVGT